MSPQSKYFAAPGWPALVGALLIAIVPSRATSQAPRFSVPVSAGSERERYLRAIDRVDSSSTKQWTIRPVDAWGEARTGLVAPSFALFANSSFPYGFNDGPVWAGKGVTAAASVGVELIRPHVAVTLAPVAFVAQNADFTIADNGRTGDRRFGDLLRPDAIDSPQRFGAKAYAAVNPGESEIALRGFGMTGGISSRSQVWGPAYEHPLIIGNNAGGIPRLFAGTQQPLGLRWVAVHGQVFWGQVNESPYGPDTGAARRHFVTGAIGTLSFPDVRGLEVGLSRFFHTSWPVRGAPHVPWLRVLQGFFIDNPAVGENPDNQLASLFLRIAPPGSGLEVYGEYGREDRTEGFRDLLLEPDHHAGYLVGFARTWGRRDAPRMTVLRGEVLNTRLSHLQQQRPQTPWYMHVSQSQGHTERGQFLASAGGYGGGASNVALDRYSTGGRTSIRWDRIVRGTARTGEGLPILDHMDVIHAAGVERSVFTGRGELTISVALVKNFNRYFLDDATNGNVALSYRLLR